MVSFFIGKRTEEEQMALLTKGAIMSAFEEMLEEMAFDKITVSALVDMEHRYLLHMCLLIVSVIPAAILSLRYYRHISCYHSRCVQ